MEESSHLLFDILISQETEKGGWLEERETEGENCC